MVEQLIECEFNLLDKLLFNSFRFSIEDYNQKIDIQYTIDRIMNEVSKLNDRDKIHMYISKLAIVPFLKRDINLRYGEGYRKTSYWAFIKIHSIIPHTMEHLLNYFPNIGYWGDLNNIYRLVFETKDYYYRQRLLDKIINIFVSNLKIEECKFNNGITTGYSLLCKWIPKQKSSLDKDTKIVNRIVKSFYPWLYKRNKFQALKRYRHLVSDINKLIKTTEIYMCNKEFAKINFNTIPLKCLKKNKRVWLDENKKGKRKNLLLLDRTISRNNYLDYIETANRNVSLKITEKNNYHSKTLLNKLDDVYFNNYKDDIKNLDEVDCIVSMILFNR